MKPRRLLLLSALLLGLSACSSDPARGYTFGGVYDTSRSTVAVEIFRNDTHDRDFEYDLVDAMIKTIERQTPYKVASPRDADTILTGRIRSVERRQLSKSPQSGLSEEVALSVTIDVEWLDLRTGGSLLKLESFTSQGVFFPSRPLGEPLELGRFAAVQSLAQDVVDQMQAAW